jgi:hypothetical protein
MKRIWVIFICICLVTLAGCSNGKAGLVSASSTSPASAIPSNPPVATDSSSPTSETRKLVLAEDDNTNGIFRIGMTREEVTQTLSENKLRLKQNGYSDENIIMHTGRCETVDGITILFGDVGKYTDLLDEIVIYPVSKTGLYSPYVTQKGLKIGDDVETVLKLYGEPLKKLKSNSSLTPFLLGYYYELPTNDGSGVISMDIDVSQAENVNFNKVDSIAYYR